MAWESLKERFGSDLEGLPLIIAGPVLRRVEKDSVSVWVALRKQQKITLKIWEAGKPEVIIMKAANLSTEKFGKYLHILVITAKATGQHLMPGNVYCYNLEFDEGMLVEASGELGDGILVNYKYYCEIAYPGYLYPSFVMPASEIGNLKLIHGSCRKPHGGELDTLHIADILLANSVTPVNEYLKLGSDQQEREKVIGRRPQLMCFTGDQIYADDVADALLFMLIDASKVLLDWIREEPLPHYFDYSDEELGPGFRDRIIAKDSKEISRDNLSSSAAKSHLIKLGEYYAMYLFVWSDVLWPDELPEKSDVFTPLISMKQFYFNKERKTLKGFKSTLPNVRRALANIPCYMIFDDHEVTDDWFLTLNWSRICLQKGSITRRILSNGLAAYVVFQDWGNVPDRYQEIYANWEVIKLLRSLPDQIDESKQIKTFEELEQWLLPEIEQITVEEKESWILVNKSRTWNFQIDFEKFRLAFLDTRTKRIFPSKEGYPGLINPELLTEHLPKKQDGHQLVIVISPAPILGNPWIEKKQDLIGRVKEVPITPIKSWTISNPLGGMYALDQEAPIFHRSFFEQFLDRLSQYERVIILSGDVHYSFSAVAEYWNERGDLKKNAVFCQLCSSAIQNSDAETMAASTALADPAVVDYDFWGWDNAKEETFSIQNPDPENSEKYLVPPRSNLSPFMVIVDPRFTYKIERSPEWQYKIRFCKDHRMLKSRGFPDPPKVSDPPTDLEKLKVVKFLLECGQRTVVGKDSLGLVYFDWDNNKHTVIHEHWYYSYYDLLSYTPYPHAHTVHKAELNIPDTSIPQPDPQS